MADKTILPGELAAHAALARLRIRADPAAVEITRRLLGTTQPEPADGVPKLTHTQAMGLGEALARKWATLVGTPAPEPDDLVWGDLVQFILHAARQEAEAASSGLS